MLISIIIVVIILICAYVRIKSRDDDARARTRRFISGFWRAPRACCDAKGYSDAYLFIGLPDGTGSTSRAYIVALSGARGSINCPFEFGTRARERAYMMFDGVAHDIDVELDELRARMIWRDTSGDELFVWEKNGAVSAELFDDAAAI